MHGKSLHYLQLFCKSKTNQKYILLFFKQGNYLYIFPQKQLWKPTTRFHLVFDFIWYLISSVYKVHQATLIFPFHIFDPIKPVVPNLFGTRDQFCGREFFHRPGVGQMVSGRLKCITFIVCFISIITSA